MHKRYLPGWRVARLSALHFTLLILFAGSTHSAIALFRQERRLPQPELGLEITFLNNARPPLKFSVHEGGRAATLIRRQHLIVNDPKLAADFTAVDIGAEAEGQVIKVRLSIIYNDLSNQEWWKEKKEKVIGSFLVREGESVRPSELMRFGIDPFEIRAINGKPVVFQPGEGPRIINNTKALEIVRVEKSLDDYRVWLKNNSSKNVVAYTISTGGRSLSADGVGYGNILPALAAGATSTEKPLYGLDVEKEGITIPVVVFEDGSFEGDPKLAARFLASGDGIRIQAPHVLLLVEQTLAVNDAELPAAFEKLEAQLWKIPEAIDKQSALELLKTKYPTFDDETISFLYEELKGGLYKARNRALAPIGDIKRDIQEDEQHRESSPVTIRASLLREALTRIKNDFERIIMAKR